MTDFDQWYQGYPNKKARGDAVKAWKALNPDAELVKRMILALDAQKRWRREAVKTKEFVAPWKMPATWIRQECWDDEIGSVAELKEKQESRKCTTPDCQGDAMKTGYCIDCEAKRPDWRSDMLRERWRQLAIQKSPDYRTPCLKAIYSINPVYARLIGRG